MSFDPKLQLGSDPTSYNEQFFFALIRHQIGLMRLSGGIRNEILKILDKGDKEIGVKLRELLNNYEPGLNPQNVRRIDRLISAIEKTRAVTMKEVADTWAREMLALARKEPEFMAGIIKTVSPVVIDPVLPALTQAVAIAKDYPFEGKTLREWANNFAQADINRISDQIKIGLVQGETRRQITQRVLGSGALNGVDGAVEMTRRQAVAITRTATNAIGNRSRRNFYQENASLFEKEVYVATLDARTTTVCASNDGKEFPIGQGPLPPLHFNCRSLRVAVLSEDGLIGDRPMRQFTEKQLLREYSTKNGLGTVTKRANLPRGTKTKFDKFARQRMRELTGTVPAKTTYQEFLSKQSREFVEDTLGKTKSKLFIDGKLKLDKFVNRAGDELNLATLAKTEAAAFRAAGLDPKDFL
jgi:hypothetical protein